MLEPFASEVDRDRLHRLVLDMLRLWHERPAPALEPAMLGALHEHGPCSFCRESATRRLLELGALTAQMAT